MMLYDYNNIRYTYTLSCRFEKVLKIFLLLIGVTLQNSVFPQLAGTNTQEIPAPSTYQVTIDSLLTLSNRFKNQNFDSTYYYARSAQLIAESSNDTSLMVSLSMKLMNTALHYRKLRKFAEAEKIIYTCIDLREKSGKEHTLIGAYVNLAINHYYHRKYEKGMGAGLKAMEISLKYLDSPDSAMNASALDGLGSSNYWLGQIYYEKGEYYTAIRYFTESVHFREINGNQRTKAQSLAGLARIYGMQNDFPKAILYYNEALSLYQEIGSVIGITMVYRGLGNIYEIQKDYKKALSYYTNSLSLKIDNSMDSELYLTYQMLGILYFQISSLHEDEMLAVVPSYKGYQPGQATRLLRDTAEYYLSEACELSKLAGDELIMIKSLLGLADISILKMEFEKAILQLTEVITVGKKMDAKTELFESYRQLALASEKLKRFEDAYYYYQYYSSLKDTVFNENSTRQIAEIQIEFETEKKDQEIELLNNENEIKSLMLSRQKAVRHGLIAGIVLLFLAGFLLYRSFRLRKKLEQQQAIISERKRISADLHDDVGSGLSRIMLLTELVKDEARTPETRKEAEKIASISRELSANISEIIWALNANNDNMESMLAYIRRYSAEFFENSAVKLSINTPGAITKTPISGELRRDIFYTVKEALHNIFKHSQATEAMLSFAVNEKILTVIIHDNGTGMPEKETERFGNGLNNMRQRMADINGSIQIENHHGTKITLTLPV